MLSLGGLIDQGIGPKALGKRLLVCCRVCFILSRANAGTENGGQVLAHCLFDSNKTLFVFKAKYSIVSDKPIMSKCFFLSDSHRAEKPTQSMLVTNGRLAPLLTRYCIWLYSIATRSRRLATLMLKGNTRFGSVSGRALNRESCIQWSVVLYHGTFRSRLLLLNFLNQIFEVSLPPWQPTLKC